MERARRVTSKQLPNGSRSCRSAIQRQRSARGGVVGKIGEEYFLLGTDEIYAFLAEGDLVWIMAASKYLATQTLKVLEERLKNTSFRRIHRNALVNVEHVRKMSALSSQRWLITMNNDRGLFDKLPLESASSSLSSLVTLAAPGISADSNGLFHGLGDHASNSFSLDGQQITDQQSKVFSNQIPLDAVQSMEVIEGAPPAEYGDKTSVVIDVTTRSGLGFTTPHGDFTASYGTFGTANGAFDLSYGGQKWGNFIAVNGLDTGRFLDGPEFHVYHDHGNEENIFDRIDLKPSQADSINLNFSFTRSWFQTPNSFDAQTADAWSGLVVNNGGLGPNGVPVGSQDQRSKIRTFNIAPAWTHLLNPNTVLTVGAFVRQDQYNYYPSGNPFADFTPDLQSETIGQNRRLTNGK